ncbi:IclR family transcriptional regulator [Alphaproteobacteria bacterium LSUCC0684]
MSQDNTPPNLRILRILETIAEADSPLTPTEINARLGWPKQSLHRLCNTLISEGYIDKRNKRLFPRQRLFDLFNNLSRHSTMHAARHQILLDVAHAVRETINFVRPETKGMFYADRIETNWAFRVQLPIGSHVPFHCTASGKTYLAHLPAAKRRVMLDSLDLRAFTAHTHRTVASLERELEVIATQGYALDREEFYDAMVAVAVPVRDARRRFHAALAVHGPKPRFSLDDAMACRKLLTDAAARISNTIEI